jgi:branched-chain amino acid aminotransferase
MTVPVVNRPPELPIASPMAAAVANEFGSAFSAHMVTATWSAEGGWSRPGLTLREAITLDPAAVGLHYGQAVFEGLKAHRQADGGLAIFRPRAHAARMRRSAARLMMPEPPEELFIEALDALVRADAEWLPDDPALSLYLRPLLLATEPTLALRPARHYLFAVLAFCTKGFFSAAQEPVSVWVRTTSARAVTGGTGAAKCAGNYAPAFLAQAEAAAHGCQQVVWLDAIERRWIEEMGGMNLLFVRDRGGVPLITTPPLASGTVLPGVTRDTLLTLAPGLGYQAVEEPITLDDWRSGCLSGEISETIACGTAAIVAPIGRAITPSEEWIIGNGGTGPVAERLWQAIRSVQRGLEPDPHRWLYRVGP